MKHLAILTTAAALLPLAGSAGEPPLWEIRGRFDGGGNPQLRAWIGEMLTRDAAAAVIGDQAVFRIAGFDNPDTPEQDWVAEIRGLADPATVMKELEARAGVGPDGRITIQEDGMSCIVWRDENAVVRLAGPPLNAGTTVEAAAGIAGDALLSGWVDFSRLSTRAELESMSLKLPEQLAFSTTAAGEGMELRLDAGLATPGLAEEARELLEALQSELSADPATAAMMPPLELVAKDRTLTLKVVLTGGQLGDLIEELEQAIGER
jgi:hypothetical protein